MGVSLAVKPTAKLSIFQNYLVGEEWSSDVDGGVRNLLDTVVSYAATDKLTVLGNFDYGRDELEGDTSRLVGLCGLVQVPGHRQVRGGPALRDAGRWLAIRHRWHRPRVERHADGRVQGHRWAHDALRVPHRLFDDPFFEDHDGDLKSNQTTLSVSFIYAFSSK